MNEAVDPSPLTVTSLNWDDEEEDIVSDHSLLSETSSYSDQNMILDSSLGEVLYYLLL
jgi:hypothetical protein